MNTRHLCTLALGLTLALLQGCASTRTVASDPRDPFETANRQIYAFNDRLDTAVVRPVAQVWAERVPNVVRAGVRNVLGNLGDVWTTVNAALQLKGQATAESAMRVAVNSTLGIYGLFDIASEAGLEKRREDLGQTLGRWGVPSGPYLVLPVFGPSSLRDLAAMPVDWQASPGQYFPSGNPRAAVALVNVTETRAGLLRATDAIRQASLDPYSFVRDAWLQKRENDVYDGNPPPHFDYADPDKTP